MFKDTTGKEKSNKQQVIFRFRLFRIFFNRTLRWGSPMSGIYLNQCNGLGVMVDLLNMRNITINELKC